MCTSVCTYTVLIRQCVPIQFLSVSVYLYSSYPSVCTYTVLIRQCVPIQFLSVSVYLYSSYPSVCTCTVLIRQCVPVQFLSVSVYLYSSYPVFFLLVHLPVFFSYFAVLTMDFKKPGLATTAWHLRDYPVGLRVIPVLKIHAYIDYHLLISLLMG